MATTVVEEPRTVPNGNVCNTDTQNHHQESVQNQDDDGQFKKLPKELGTDWNFKMFKNRRILWDYVIGFLVLHVAAFYGFYLCFYAKFYTVIWMFFLSYAAIEGTAIGSHRLYAHRSFKAKGPFRAALILCQTLSGQYSVYYWAHQHRLHHKYADTDADPHSAQRGFFFSHMGWLMVSEHPAVTNKMKTIDTSDLEADKLVMFQYKYHKYLYVIFSIMLPVWIPMYFWGETFVNSLFISYFGRHVYQFNCTMLVNSAAHRYGTRPYDKNLLAVENFIVSFLTSGEGWHNYHHAFPWDYRAAELGFRYNISTIIINLMAMIGQAYDLKSTTPPLLEKRIQRTGDVVAHTKYSNYNFLMKNVSSLIQCFTDSTKFDYRIDNAPMTHNNVPSATPTATTTVTNTITPQENCSQELKTEQQQQQMMNGVTKRNVVVAK